MRTTHVIASLVALHVTCSSREQTITRLNVNRTPVDSRYSINKVQGLGLVDLTSACDRPFYLRGSFMLFETWWSEFEIKRGMSYRYVGTDSLSWDKLPM